MVETPIFAELCRELCEVSEPEGCAGVADDLVAELGIADFEGAHAELDHPEEGDPELG